MFAVLFGLFGLTIGSFLNVVILRKGARPLTGRSACFSCSTQIHWYDNVPVVSWLVLRGRCRTCGSRISLQYPLVELFTGILFFIAGAGLSLALLAEPFFILYLFAISGVIALLVAITVYDIRHTIIPDAWAYSFALLAFGLAFFTQSLPLPYLLLSGPAAAILPFSLWYVSKGRWMGLGDAKLALGIGFFLGPAYGVVAVFSAFIIGAVVSVCILLPLPRVIHFLRNKGIAGLSPRAAHFTMKSEVPFGPFLIAGFFFVWFSLLYHLPLPV